MPRRARKRESGRPVASTIARLASDRRDSILRILAGTPRLPMSKPQPLAGIRVIELGTLIAGPFCARLLAEFGAEVIKIEAPDGGDPLRKWRKLHRGTSLWWYVQARNKKSLTLNLREPEAQEVVRRLAKDADIV